MSPQQELWYGAQNQLEADRLLDMIHLFERLNVNYAVKCEILRRSAVSDSALYDFAAFSSLAQEKVIKRWEYLTGKKYVFKPDEPKKSIWELNEDE